jgi:hypothetical protein
MIPSGDVYEAAWKILTGLLLGVLLGGFGVGLLAWAVWQWLTERSRFLWTSDRTTLTVLKEVSGANRERSRRLEPVDGQSG